MTSNIATEIEIEGFGCPYCKYRWYCPCKTCKEDRDIKGEPAPKEWYYLEDRDTMACPQCHSAFSQDALLDLEAKYVQRWNAKKLLDLFLKD